MPTYHCGECGRKIHSQHELVQTPKLLCTMCQREKFGDRVMTKGRLSQIQEGRCIVHGCPWQQKGKFAHEGIRVGLHSWADTMHIHRIKTGRLGGKYELENCVLACPHHHKRLEGLTREEIMQQECTEEEIDRMDKFHTAKSLLDYPFSEIAQVIERLCKGEWGVLATCEHYDIIGAIRRELTKE